MTNATKLELGDTDSIKQPGMMIKIDGCDVEIHGTQREQEACAAHIMLALHFAAKADTGLVSCCEQWQHESDEIMEQLRKFDI